MTPIRQFKDDKLCGHCCVAMAADVRLYVAIEAIGHRRGTHPWELVNALAKLGVTTSYERYKNTASLSSRCIANIRSKSRPSWGHWVLIWDDIVVDPAHHPGVFTPSYPPDSQYVGFMRV